jgi:hypothetical protein
LAVTQFEGAYWVEIASGDNPLIGWAEYSIMIDVAEEDVGMLIEMLDEDARRAKHWIVSDAHDGRLGDIDRLNELDSISLPGGVPYEIYLNNSGKLAKDHIKGQALSETVTAEIEAQGKALFLNSEGRNPHLQWTPMAMRWLTLSTSGLSRAGFTRPWKYAGLVPAVNAPYREC